jgi:hypothetical protein
VLVSRAGPRRIQAAGVLLEGEAVVLRTEDGRPVRISGAGLKRAVHRGTVLFQSETPADDVDILLP